jgi:uncharacterized protein DUF4276
VVTEIWLYFEGENALRGGFHEFLKEIVNRARDKRIKFRLRPCGATATADYQIALKKHPDALNILLRDSDGLEIPNPPKDSEFWMVELMEAWFLADPEALEGYYGNPFPRAYNPRVEELPKADVLARLRDATRHTQKGPYHKTKHAPHILERIDPAKVRKAAPNCERLFHEVLAKLA